MNESTYSLLDPGIGPSPDRVRVPSVLRGDDERRGEGGAEGGEGGGGDGHVDILSFCILSLVSRMKEEWRTSGYLSPWTSPMIFDY
jgi:hypothetical protein